MKTSEKPTTKPSSHEEVVRAIAGVVGTGGLPDEEAEALASEAVAEVRAARPRPVTVGRAPSPEEVRVRRHRE